jgi:hypothetical protein
VDLLASLAGDGVVTAAELARAGIDQNAVARLRRGGRLVRLFQGTYAVTPLREPEFALACRGAARYAGRDAVIVGEAALALSSAYPPPPTPEVAVPRARFVRPTPGLRLSRLADEWLVRHRCIGGVDVQDAARAVVWAWTRTSPRDGSAVVCAAVRAGAVRTDEVRRVLPILPRVARRGGLLDACAYVDAGCESPAEIDYLVGVERAYRLPPGERQAVIEVPGGRTRRVDVRYGRVVVEIDGAHHRDPEQQRADNVRDVVLTALGLVVIRVTADEVRRDPGLVAATVANALAKAA